MNKITLIIAVFLMFFAACSDVSRNSNRYEAAKEDEVYTIEEKATEAVYDDMMPPPGEPGQQVVPDEDQPEEHNTEEYDRIVENPFKEVLQNPLSTFSIDVDNASYSNVRRYIESNSMPPKDAVRIEEMINYFTYDYPDPKGKHPFEFVTVLSECPWNSENKLLHIGIQGKKLNSTLTD